MHKTHKKNPNHMAEPKSGPPAPRVPFSGFGPEPNLVQPAPPVAFSITEGPAGDSAKWGVGPEPLQGGKNLKGD